MANEDDIYQALIGGAPTDASKQAALAQYLRQRGQLGQIMQASGDRVLSPMGEQMYAGSVGQGQAIASEREREANFKMMQEYRQAQEANFLNRITSAERIAGAHNITAEDVARIRAQAAIDASLNRATAKGKQLGMHERNELEQMADTTESMRGIIQDFKPEYAGVGTGAKNWIAATGLGPDKWKEAQDWWSRYNREFTLQEIHRQFGARFTAPEQQRFEAAHINPNMNAQQIQQKLQNIEPRITNMIRGRIHDYTRGGYDPDYLSGIKERLGITDEAQQIPVPSGRAPHGPAASFPSGAAPAPYPTQPAGPTPPAPVNPAMRYLTRGPAYPQPNTPMPSPGIVPQPSVRPTPPVGNLFQGSMIPGMGNQ
jgi:hypothetical protein